MKLFLGAVFGAATLLFTAISAPHAQGIRLASWDTPLKAQCLLVTAARTGSSATLLRHFEEILQGGGSRAELDRVVKPLVRLVQNRRPVSANAFELFRLEGEIADTLVIITFSDGVKLFAHLTLGKRGGGWSFLGVSYNINWDKVRPRLDVSATQLKALECRSE